MTRFNKTKSFAVLTLLFAGCGTNITQDDTLPADSEALAQVEDITETNESQTELSALSVTIIGMGQVEPPQGMYPTGSNLELVAIPGNGWGFDHWAGAVSGTELSTSLRLVGDRSVIAVFVEQNTDVRVFMIVDGPGSIRFSPVGISDAGAWIYPRGTNLTLTGVADPGFVFVSWAGASNSLEIVTSFTVEKDTIVIATFDAPPFVAGDVFSFLSVVETELFNSRVAQAVNDIYEWRNHEINVAASELNSQGVRGGGIAIFCDIHREAIELSREATWDILDDVLGLRPFLMMAEQVLEVDAWNREQYPYTACP